MSNRNFTFQGNVQVYLQGTQALWVQEIHKDGSIQYTIGSQNSPLCVHDYRKESTEAAKIAVQGKATDNFADLFNLPAKVNVVADDKNVMIEMVDWNGQSEEDPITLWMGVFEGDPIPANPVYWYQLRKMENDRTAFAVLIP